MKKILVGILAAFPLFLPATFANEDASCSANLAERFEGTDWKNAYIITDTSEIKWQRALLKNSGELELPEGGHFSISGTARPFTDVEVFFYTPQEKTSEALSPPSEGTCVKTIAGQSGEFSVDIHSSLLWGLDGENIIFDAFFPLDDWQGQKKEDTNQNFFIGTNILPSEVTIKEVDNPEIIEIPAEDMEPQEAVLYRPQNCEKVCQDPEKAHRHMIASLNYSAENASPEFVTAQAMQTFDQGTVLIVKKDLGRHTFFGALQNGGKNIRPNARQMKNISSTALGLESIKRMLTGNRAAQGANPGIEMTAENLIEAAKKEGIFSPNTEEGASLLKTFFTENDTNSRTTAIHKALQMSIDDRRPTNTFAQAMARTIPGSSEEDWAKNAIDATRFWTNSITPNTCFVQNDHNLRSNFTSAGGHSHGACDLVYLHGMSPSIFLFNTKDVLLEPNFSEEISIVTAENVFDTKNGWNMNDGEKEVQKYEYETGITFDKKRIHSACIEKNNFAEYAQKIARGYGLGEKTEEIIVDELEAESVSGNDFYSISLANPSEMEKYFSWKGNGETLNILELFFDVKLGECSEKNIPVFSQEKKEYDGVEAGIIE